MTEAKVLRPYQQLAVQHLTSLDHVFLADDMGLGKTVTAIAIDKVRREQTTTSTGHKTLVVAPLTGVVDQWVEHFEDWSDLKIRRIDPKKRNMLLKEDADVYVIHHEGLRLMEQELSQRRWLHFIIDEAHRIKNRKTKTSDAAKEVGKSARFRTALTGSPIVNHPDDLWNMLNWLYPNKASREKAGFKHWDKKLLNSYWRFFEWFVEYWQTDEGYIEIQGTRHEQELRDLLNPFYIRRLKEQVAKELPEKVIQTYHVDLGSKQRRAYDDMKNQLLSWVGENEDQPVMAAVAIAQLVRLQQFALGHGRIDTVTVRKIDGTTETKRVMRLDEPSVKLDMLMNIIEDLGDRQAIVYSTSKQAIRLAEKRLKDDYELSIVVGGVPDKIRRVGIKRFQQGESQIMLATIRAGGVGMNLQNCNTVIFLDREWSPTINNQAIDRVHRIGQEHDSVHIIDIVARNTVDQKKDRKLQRKWQWIKDTVGG